MKDFFESVFGAYKARYQNKFIGTFILFYLALNWEKVVAVFFLSEFTYQRFIFLWSMDWYELAIKVFVGAFLALVYLFFAPLVSLWVHKMQSYALTEYKVQNIKNEKRIVKEKEKLEHVRSDLLIKERDNLEMEVDNSKINRDINIYNILRSAITEQDLMDLYFGLEKDGKITSKMFDKTKRFFYELSAAENAFVNGGLSKAAGFMMDKFSVLLNEMKKNRGYDQSGYIYSHEHVKQIMKEKDSTIQSYREFINASKECFSL